MLMYELLSNKINIAPSEYKWITINHQYGETNLYTLRQHPNVYEHEAVPCETQNWNTHKMDTALNTT